MIHGLYLSGQGAQIQSTRQDVIANNLANASTNSFKRDLVRAQSHPTWDAAQGSAGKLPGNLELLPGGVTPLDTVTDFSAGQMVSTQGAFDVALSGKGFLRVSDGKKPYLTRDGQLSVTSDGRLVTREHGYAVLNGSGSPISGIDTSDSAPPLVFQPDGAVVQGGDEVGRLALVEPASYQQIEKVGNNLYTAPGKLNPAGPELEVRQGYIEASGTNPVTEMMQLIEASRAFEANVNMVKYQDDSLGRLLQSVPRKQ